MPENDFAVRIRGTVLEVYPQLGLAFVGDEQQRCWGLTRSTPGLGFESLEPGQDLRLTLQSYSGFSLVRDYARPCA